MPSEDKLLLIRNCDLWAHLDDEEYQELDIVHNFIEGRKGEYIYFEAFHFNKLYFLKEGFIRIGYIDDQGNEIIKEIIQKGEIFGQITLERNNLYGEFAQCYKSDVSLCAFTVDNFQKLLQKKPGIALKYSKQVGTKLRQTENRLLNLLNKDVKTRLLHFFRQLAEPYKAPAAVTGSFCIPNHLTHEDIAHLIGSSRQTVTTLINELAAEGLIVYNRHEICFPDVNKIQNQRNVM
jgi:CRP/FNR family cyclic AMP-dependent transcriptional regulator